MVKKRGLYTEGIQREVLWMSVTSDKLLAELEQDFGRSVGLIQQGQRRYRIGEYTKADSTRMKNGKPRLKFGD